MQDCFNESYEDYAKKQDFLENKLYLKDKTCCDADSCDKLSYEFEKLNNKCHDAYGKYWTTNEKGRINEQTLCDDINNERNNLLAKTNKYRMGSKVSGKSKGVTFSDSTKGGKKKRTKNRKNKKNRKTRKNKRK